MAIEVIKPGLATTVQDAGRPGYYNVGIPLSGALDQYALRVANLLVGNEEGAAVLGSLIGLDRQRLDKSAGLRTHMLVSVGSAFGAGDAGWAVRGVSQCR